MMCKDWTKWFWTENGRNRGI